MKKHTICLLLLAGIVDFSGCKTSSPEKVQDTMGPTLSGPEVQPSAKVAPPIVDREISVGDPFGIYDDTTFLCTVENQGLFLPVRRGKKATSQGDRSSEFYISPRISVLVDDLRKAFESKTLIQKSVTGDDDNVYGMNLTVALIDEELQKAASAQAARLGVQAVPDLFRPYPYTYLEVHWIVDDPDTTIDKLAYRTPMSNLGKPDSFQKYINLHATGTVKELSALVERGWFVGAYQGAGFKIKQNVLNASVQALSQQDFLQDLHGDAIWQDLQSYSHKQGGGEINLPFFSAGGQASSGYSKSERTSLVTRNQMLKVAEKYIARINYGEWVEISGAGQQDLTSLRQQVVNSILSNADRIEFELNSTNATIIRSEKLLADLAPDRIAKLDAELTNKFDAKKAGSASSKVGSTSNSFDLLLDDDSHFVGEGTATIPKSVTLYQINSACIDRLNEMSFKTTLVTGSTSGTLTLASTFGEAVTPNPTRKSLKGSFDVKKSEQIGGDDRDVHTKNGRNTFIVAWHGDPRVEDDQIMLPVYCVVKEGHEDWTTLRMKTTVKIKKPADFLSFDLKDIKMFAAPSKKDAFFLNSFAPAYRETWPWEIHDYRNLEMPANGLLREVQVKPDSEDGDDTLPNKMGFRGNVLIPYWAGANPVWHFSPRVGLNLSDNKQINSAKIP